MADKAVKPFGETLREAVLREHSVGFGRDEQSCQRREIVAFTYVGGERLQHFPGHCVVK